MKFLSVLFVLTASISYANPTQRVTTALENTLFNILKSPDFKTCMYNYHHLVEKRSYYVDLSYIKANNLTWTPYMADIGGVSTSFVRLKINGNRAADENLMIGFVTDSTVTVSLDAANNVTHVYCTIANDDAGIVKESVPVQEYTFNPDEIQLFNDFQHPLIKQSCLDSLPAFTTIAGARQQDPDFVQDNYKGNAVAYLFTGPTAQGTTVETTISVLRDSTSGFATAYGCETK